MSNNTPTQSDPSTDMGNLTITEWKELRNKLTDTDKIDENWERAIQFFNYRLNHRYLEPLDSMINNGMLEGEGFSIVTVQCALIEFYAAMVQGKVYNHNVAEDDIYYKRTANFYRDFLKDKAPFDKYFGTGKTFDEKDFYSNVRCALVHSCSTRNNWVIREISEEDAFFIDKNDGKKVVNRGQLQKELKVYHKNYLAELREPNNQELRKFLGRKLDDLCELQPDNKYWWTA